MPGAWKAIICLVLPFLLALPLGAAEAGANRDAKAAVHVLPHDDFRTCSQNFPEISDCSDITTTCDCCGGVDVFPVFFDIEECLGVEYGLAWPGSGSCTFRTCSDLHIGDIWGSGDGISQVWFSCKTAPAVIPGFGWIDITQPARICVVPHPENGLINILDCGDALDEPVATFCAGVCGETGDDPCETVFLPLDLEKTDGMGSSCASAGDSIIYEISYANDRNPDDVHNVVLTDYLSSRVEFKSSTGGGAYEAAGHRVQWGLGSLPGGASDTVRLAVKVRNTASPGSRIDNRCEITGTGIGVTEPTSSITVCEGGEFQFKVAVHVVEHNGHRTCSSGIPIVTGCVDITTISEAYSVDAFPVFFDLNQYLGLEYGLAWCDSGICEAALFTDCSDLTIGDIEQSGDGISQAWVSCHYGPAVPGWAWIYASGPSLICLVPHPQGGSLSVLDCAENVGTPMCNFCAGVYGKIGDDPCVPTNVQPTTWGEIKAMFR